MDHLAFALQVETLQSSVTIWLVSPQAQPTLFSAPACPRRRRSRLTLWARELKKAQRHADHPWNASLKSEALMQQAKAVLRTR